MADLEYMTFQLYVKFQIFWVVATLIGQIVNGFLPHEDHPNANISANEHD